MQIAGLVKQSLIDYPGKVAAVVFTQGCNFRCGYCHNPSLVLPKLFYQNKLITTGEVLNYLDNRKSWLEGVVVTGGEPTIHGGLPLFLKQIKEIGLSVKLDTNGSGPQMIDLLLNHKLIDFVAMDIKAIPETGPYTKVIGRDASRFMPKIFRTIELIKKSGVEYEFRTTIVGGLHDSDTIEKIENSLNIKNKLVTNRFRESERVELFINQ
jgi:pyruvate formate lyase activating enzyme